MRPIPVWHGCQCVVWALAAAAPGTPPIDGTISRVGAKAFDIDYCVSSAAMPLDTVRMWYTLDKGASWQLYGPDADCQPPLRFNAPQEGLCGFYFVAVNAAGSSGPEPQTGTAAHRWAYVDYTPPIVQLHRPEPLLRSDDHATAAIRWSAIDAHLLPRPVSLAYRAHPDGTWQTVAKNLPNTGRYDWSVPADLLGSVIVRLTVVDQGLNRVEATAQFEVAPPPAAETAPVPMSVGGEGDQAALVAHSQTFDEAAQARSRKMYQAALWHRSRGETKLAMARLRDALRLDPTQSLALVDLASILYGEGDHEAAMQAYRLALRQDPDLRSGLEGAARAAMALRNYPDAAEFLQRIIRNDPNDVSAWLNLGDVAVYQGDELTARERYEKAATLNPNAGEVIAQARMRLADLSWLCERYQQTASTP